ncbi:NAD+ diphosphatase [Lachnospiraceae bacterium XBB1006]|nr:NAD+ diphosphatase [Lachnospiraceae bacterium XBB1006]
MLQDIEPKIFINEFRQQEASQNDRVIAMKGGKVLMKVVGDEVILPRVKDFADPVSQYRYLFSVDDETYVFRTTTIPEIPEGFSYEDRFALRDRKPADVCFAGVVGYHLGLWYEQNRFCGCCGSALEVGTTERSLVCPKCGNVVYPRLNPAVIVAVVHEDKILLSRYAHGHTNRYSLIAGFCEIGESVEQTVHREVMEETGLKVKNFGYFGSQPWPFTSSLLMGYFVELDGGEKITLDETELSEAVWFDREHLPETHSTLSLTWTMIEYFRNHPELEF